ncbi:MFS transporter [Sphingomonas sp. I4]
MTDSTRGGDAIRVNHGFIAAIVVVATIGGFMFGYDSGVINGTQRGWRPRSTSVVWVSASMSARSWSDRRSARSARGACPMRSAVATSVMLAAGLFLVSALLAGAAGSSAIFIFARIIGGLGVGAASVISPVYISEVTPASISRPPVERAAGDDHHRPDRRVRRQFRAGALCRWLDRRILAGLPAWRWMFWLQAIPAAIYFAALSIIPESPRFLVAKGRDAEAHTVLTKLFGEGEATRKVAEIRRSLSADQHKPKLSDLVDKTTGKIRPILWAGIGLAVFQQLVGINVVFYYGATLWEAVGFSEDYALQTNILSGVLSIAACLFTIATVDKIGRKPLLLIGSAGMAVTLAIVAYAFSTAVTGANGAVSLPGNNGVIALVAANLYVIFFNASWGPVMWVMLGEMFPNQIRGSGLAVSGFAQWIANAAISVSFPALAVSPGLSVTYFGYAFFAAVSFFFVRAMVNETRGRELEDMAG